DEGARKGVGWPEDQRQRDRLRRRRDPPHGPRRSGGGGRERGRRDGQPRRSRVGPRRNERDDPAGPLRYARGGGAGRVLPLLARVRLRARAGPGGQRRARGRNGVLMATLLSDEQELVQDAARDAL